MRRGGRPEVSVVIPTHNRWPALQVALDGVRSQRDVGLEIVIVDDGGPPTLSAALTGLEGERVRVIRSPSCRGPAAARNLGLHAARGHWVAFLDDDDLWAPTKLVRQLEAAHEAGAGWAWCGACFVRSD